MEENTIKKEEKNEQPFDSAQGKLQELEKKCEEYLNNWKRAAADFINYKKDEMERMAFLAKYAKEDMILKILPLLDSIHLAQTQMPEDIKNNSWSEGFLQIQKQIEEFLKKEGIEEIKVVGEKFNPETMDIVEEVDLPAEALAKEEGSQSGTIVEESQKGYIMDGKVLRPAKVKISK